MEQNQEPQKKSQSEGPIRRRIIIIKRALQMKYVFLVIASVLLTVTFVSLDIYYIIGKLFVKEFGEMNLVPIIKNASALLGIHLIVFIFIVAIVSIFISHKLAGPIFRLEKVSEAVAQGDLTVKVNLRQGDELFETAEYINRMIDSLRIKAEQDQNLAARILNKLTDLSGKLDKGEITPKQAHIVINELLPEIRHIASEFKI